ncbi:MAG: FhaA domain-containing protein [Stackebrandtia sp.]
MTVLGRFEKRLESLFEGAFAKIFKGVVHPVEIAGAMQREAESHKAILAGGRILVPNRYVIDLSPPDHERLAPYAAALAQELAQSQAEHIGEHGWTVYGDVIVEIERGEGLDTGMFRVIAEVAAQQDQHAQQGAPGQMMGGGGMDAGPAGAPPPPSGPRLVSGDGRQYALTMGSTTIGRGEQAQIRLPDVGISRVHVRIDYDGGQVLVTDLGSTNGTLVNGQRISTIALQPGDMIQLGTTSLTLQAS